MKKKPLMLNVRNANAIHHSCLEGLLAGVSSAGIAVASILSLSSVFAVLPFDRANGAIAISDSTGAGAVSSGTTLAAGGTTNSSGGSLASNAGVALVGDGDCSVFSGDNTYAGVYGDSVTTFVGGMYGFGQQTSAISYNVAGNAGSNAGVIGYNPTKQIFGHVSYSGYSEPGIGNTQTANRTDALGYTSFAVGCNSRARGIASTALGLNNQANGTASIAMGQSSIANAGGTIAMGLAAQAAATDSIALGSLSYASARNSMALGSNAQATGISATALGSTANGRTVNSVFTVNGVSATGDGSVAIGGNATAGAQANASDSIAIGGQSVANGTSAIAIGLNSKATGSSTIAIGVSNTVSGNNSGAIGDPTTITGSGSYSLGNDNQIDADNAGIFGSNSKILSSGSASRIIGNSSTVVASDAFIIGNTAGVSVSGGVAIGSSSFAFVAAGAVGYDPLTNAASLSASPIWVSTRAVVSIGNGAVSTRQLSGLAAGTNDTDAVNIAQLKSLRNYATQGWNLSIGSGNASNVSLASTVNFSAGSTNLTAAAASTGVGVVFDLAQNISLTTVTTGNTTLNTGGLTITSINGPTTLTATGLSFAGGPTITTTGINAAGQKVTNLADASLSPTSTDAVTGKQLNATNTSVTTLSNNVTSYAGNINTAIGSGDITSGTAPSFSIQGTPISNVAGAFGAVDTVLTGQKNSITSLQSNALQYSGGVFVATRYSLDQKITGVAAGTAANDAVNVGQLNTAISGTAWNLSVGGVNKTSIGNGATVDLSAGSSNNLVITRGTGTNNISFDLAQNIAVTSVTTGNATLSTTGFTITGGPSLTTSGLNAAGQQVTNIADATLSDTSTDAVTGKQLFAVSSNLTTLTGNVTSYASNINKALGSGDIVSGVAPSFSIQGSTKNSVLAAFSAVDSAISTNKANITTNTGNITILQNNALQYNGSVFVATRGGLDQKITGVATGTASNDAVNVGQLNTAISGAAWNLTVGGTNSSTIGKGSTVDLSAGSSNNLVVTKANGTNNISFDLASDIALTSVTAGNSVLNTNGLAITVGQSLTSLTATGLTIAGGPSVTTSGIDAAGHKVSNLADATLSTISTDAVTGKQLNKTNTDLGATNANLVTTNTNLATTNATLATTNSNLTALSTTVDSYAANINAALGSGDIVSGVAPSFTIQGSTKNSVLAAFNAVDSAISTNKANITTNTGNITILQNNALQYNGSVFVATRGGLDKKITGVATGTASNDAVNVGQLSAAIGSSAWNLTVGGANSSAIGNGSTVDFSAGGSGNLLVSKEPNSNSVSFDLNDTIALTSVTTGNSVLNTNGLAITVGQSLTSLTATGLTIAGGPSVTTSGINAAGQKVSNLADAALSTISTDAVTGKQLNKTNTDLGATNANLVTTNTNLATTNANLATTNSNLTALGTTVDSYAANINAALGSGDITTGIAPSFTIQGSSKNSVLTAFDAVDGVLTNQKSDITTLQSNALQYSGSVFVATRGGLDQKITGVATGTASNDAVNVGQLNAAISGTAWNLSVGGVNKTSIGNGATVDLSAGSSNNLTVNRGTGTNNISFDLAQNITVTSVTTGNATLSTTGFTITGGPSLTTSGLNAAGQQVTNIADATLSDTSTDAVTGKQLFTVKANLTTLTGNVTSYVSNINKALGTGDIVSGVAPSFSIQGSTKNSVLLAFNAVDSAINNNNNAITILQNNALQYNGSVFVATRNGLDQKITGVATGTASNDAVNVGQLSAAIGSSAWNLTVGGTNSSAIGNGATVDLSAGSSNNLVVTKANGTNNISFDLADNIALTSVTTGNSVLNTNGLAITVGQSLTSLTATGLTIAGGPSVTTSGIDAAGHKVSNIADANLSTISTDAVTGKQLNKTNTDLGITNANLVTTNTNLATTNANLATTNNNLTILGTTVDSYAANINAALGSGDITTGIAPSFTIQGSSKNSVLTAFDAVDGVLTNQKSDITTLQSNALQYNGSVFVATRGGLDKKITGVATGTASNDAVNVGQLNAAIGSSAWNLTVGGANSSAIGNGATVDFSAGSSGNLLVSKEPNSNNVSFDLNDTIALTSVTTGNSVLNTNGLAITGLAGTTSLSASGLSIAGGPSVTTSGINAAGKKVSNLADAALSTTSTEAVTGKQLNKTNTDLGTTNSNLIALGTTVDSYAANINAALGSGDITTGIAPSFTIQGSSKNSVLTAFDAVDSAINNSNKAITTLQGSALQYNGSFFDAKRNGLDKRINGVATGTASNDAVNVGQLNAAIGSSAWNLTVGGANSSAIGNGSTVDFSGGSSGNLIVSKEPNSNNVSFDLNDTIALTSVTTGNSVLNTNGLAITVGQGLTSLTATGLTIAGGPSVTTSGINAAGQKVNNLADAALSITSTDAVTGKQLNKTNTDLGTTNSNLTALGNKVDTQATNINTALGGGANIANGTAPTYTIQGVDKMSVGDAFGAVDSAITTNNNHIAANTKDITDLQANALQYNGTVFVATREGVSQRIIGVANGIADNDAVNKSQLDTVVSNSGWYLTTDGKNSVKVGVADSVDLKSGKNIEISKTADSRDVSFALADNIALTSVTTGNALLNDNGLAIAIGQGVTSLTATGLSIAGGPSVTTSGIDAAGQKVSNLADAALSTTSTDAVTGKQLNKTNTDLDTTNANLATTNSNLTALGTKVDIQADNINKAFGSGDIISGAAPSFDVQGSKYNSVNTAFGAVDTSLNDIKGQITNINTDALKWDSGIGAFNAARDNGNGEKIASRITNVAAGALTATSTDVINGSQLFSTNERITQMADLTSAALGGAADLANGVGPTFQVSTIVANNSRLLRAGPLVSTYNNVGDALTKIDANVNIVNDKVNAVADNVANLHSNALLWDETSGAFNAGRSENGELVKSKIINIADGSLAENSSEAVTGGQLYSSNSQIASFFGSGAAFANGNWTAPNFIISQIDASGNRSNGNYSNVGDAFGGVNSSINNVNQRVSEVKSQIDNMGPDTEALRYDATLGGYNAGSKNNQPNKIVNVENGTIAQGSKDAVNGGQLWDTNQKIDNIQNNVNDVANNAVAYDKDANGNKTNSITLKGADVSKPVVINNVADGKIEKGSKQAINAGQLYDYTKEQMNVTLNDAKAYTDQRIETFNRNAVEQANYYTDTRFNQLNSSIKDARKEARQAAAIGLAASSLRFDSTPGKVSVAAGSGFWKSEGAFAVGAGYTSETGKVRANVTATSAGGDFGVGAGVSITLN